MRQRRFDKSVRKMATTIPKSLPCYCAESILWEGYQLAVMLNAPLDIQASLLKAYEEAKNNVLTNPDT
jgi:hypothetical protein